jgi:Pyruvate/2-oxoacid:ferredoxin oxidoreductase gamma subunit
MRRILDSNTRVMAQGYNKLLEASKANKIHLQNRMRNIIKSLTDKDLGFVMAAYNGLKQRSRMLNGEGMGTATMKKVQLVKRLTNQSHNQQVMAVNSLKQFMLHERNLNDLRQQELARQHQEKHRVLKRIMDSNLRMCGTGFRQAYQFTIESREQERVLVNRQRGIMRRILDSNIRVMAQGYNKLVEEANTRKSHLKNKLKSLIKSLTDKDLGYMMVAYHGLKQRSRMLGGEGMGTANMKKVQLIKRLTNQSHNQQVMAVNSLTTFLSHERNLDELIKQEQVRQQREKERILRRIMDSNLRMCGTGFRQAKQWTVEAREKERVLINRQRGIMRRILDSNIRVMAQGYNKLAEEAKGRKVHLQNKMRNLIKSLTDKDLGYVTVAYHGLKQRSRMLNGEGMGSAST